MAQEALNSIENINIPHGVSLWFQLNWTGNYVELGDLLIDAFTINPDFVEFRSYRNGLNALRKRILSGRNASLTATLNEPNIVNFQRVLSGGTISSNQSVTLYEGRHLTVDSDGGGLFVDMADAGETDFANINVIGIYDKDDAIEATNECQGDLTPDTDGKVYFTSSDTGAVDGDTVYVKYKITATGMYKTEIYGADEATIEGAAQIQARNQQGGVMQVWELASVSLGANGDIGYALDAVQTIPIQATLQERSGSFGNFYAK